MVAMLLLTLTVVPSYTMPNGLRWAYAEALHGQHMDGSTAWATSPTDERAVSASNENEQKDKDNRRDHGNNANDNNGNDNGDSNGNGNGNDDDDGCCAPPPPPPQRSAPPPPANQSSACLSAGGTVSLTLNDGTATVKVFQDNLNVVLDRVDAGSVPGPSGSIVGNLVFRVSGSPCGGAGFGSLPNEANLGIAYRNRVAEAGNESTFTIMFWDGQKWTATPKQALDAGSNYVSATIQALGVYAVVQQ
jgi:hypothetical protein